MCCRNSERGSKVNVVRAAAVACGVLALVGCNSPPRVVRYRLTIEIEDSGVIRTGSVVQEEHCTFNDGLLKGLGSAVDCGAKGEALVVDLGEKGLLFAVLKRDEANPASLEPFGLLVDARRDILDKIGLTSSAMARIAKASGSTEIGLNKLPLLVRFRDLNDPKTVERIDPRDLATSFGLEVGLKRATIEVIHDPLTTGIEKRLSWLVGGWLEKPLFPRVGPLRNTSDVPQIEDLTDGDFWRFMQ